jgi:hypothetical protein
MAAAGYPFYPLCEKDVVNWVMSIDTKKEKPVLKTNFSFNI